MRDLTNLLRKTKILRPVIHHHWKLTRIRPTQFIKMKRYKINSSLPRYITALNNNRRWPTERILALVRLSAYGCLECSSQSRGDWSWTFVICDRGYEIRTRGRYFSFRTSIYLLWESSGAVHEPSDSHQMIWRGLVGSGRVGCVVRGGFARTNTRSSPEGSITTMTPR